MRKKERYSFKWDIKKKEYKKGYSEVSQSGFYNRSEWQKIRNYYIFINPLCERCKKKDIIKEADVVDHITPLTLDDVYSDNHSMLYDDNNLMSLCNKCHSLKTNREQKINHQLMNDLFTFPNKK
ncbi:HNH endonuclease signature motif containing protein [Carboxylicivirga sp. RSCT41]|uniref:HNH endonuclease signature motif containing protein n=1 Tax=Carboxylicivirga agarovorans TaxID=3417570 RepID=UPI003D351860